MPKMILPIVAYGASILREVAQPISQDFPDLDMLISNMWDTMYASNGVGLAAPQINKGIRLFVVDSLQVIESLEDDEKEEYPGDNGIKTVFINPIIESYEGDDWPYNEGCLSIPKIREDVMRPESIVMSWVDENFQPHKQTFTGISARIIQHEYDHLEGKLFIDYLSPMKRRLMKNKLEDISKGKVRMDYRMLVVKN